MTTATALDPLSLFRLDGKVALVTGASSGLGERFARVLDAVGARVVVAARRAERLERLAGDLTDAVVVPADLADPDDRERLAATVLDTCGRVDVLVNNAGIGGKISLEDEPLDSFRSVMEVNVTAIWHLCKLFRTALIADGGGSIVNVASMLGHVGIHAHQAGQLLRQQGRRRQPHPRAGAAVRPQERAGQRAVPRLVPVRADRRHGDRSPAPSRSSRPTARCPGWATSTSSTGPSSC